MNQDVNVSTVALGNLLRNTSCKTKLVPVPVSVAVPPMLAKEKKKYETA